MLALIIQNKTDAGEGEGSDNTEVNPLDPEGPLLNSISRDAVFHLYEPDQDCKNAEHH